jgi:3-methyladenine DNA glycosylase AlkD
MKATRAPAKTATEPSAKSIEKALRDLADPARAAASARFFKTKAGEYGHGDRFLGVRVPDQRRLIRNFRETPTQEVVALLHSPIHECRLCALLIWVEQYQRGDALARQTIADLYLKHRAHVNNWDLVDSSAAQILGAHLVESEKKPSTKVPTILQELAGSKALWDRRIAIVSTFAFIYAGRADQTLALAKTLVNDSEDLMHKAVGWLLREVGKRIDPDLLRGFLRSHYTRMPRTMLRYAIEHFDASERQKWLGR